MTSKNYFLNIASNGIKNRHLNSLKSDGLFLKVILKMSILKLPNYYMLLTFLF